MRRRHVAHRREPALHRVAESYRGVVGNCEKNWISQSNGGSALTAHAVASCTVLSIERIEVDDLARWHDRRLSAMEDGGAIARGASKQRDGRNDRDSNENGARLHCRVLSPFFSSIAPGTSMPARTANGRYCQVRMRSCLETMMPATMPNPIWEMTNQSQSIRCLSTGSSASSMLWIRPDHRIGAITPPNRTGRRGNIGSAAP